MKTTMSLATLVAAASAQFYNITSDPFKITVRSEDGSVDDTISACHTGAAIESLCLSNSNTASHPSSTPYDTFYFNSSIYAQQIPNHADFGLPGILTWDLPTSDGSVPSSVTFSYDPSTNTALPLLFPGSQNPQTVYFNNQDELMLVSYINWSLNPPSSTDPYSLMDWFVCQTYFTGYQYETLVWGLGDQPQNPTCKPVKVKKVSV